jgi:flavin-dependent dehydrogenase
MDRDVVVIGAGPAGSVAAAMLAERGYSVEVLERAHFPRFSVGESLLPQSMVFLEEAGLLDVVQREGFQLKNGAIFRRGPEEQVFDLSEKTAEGWAITYQVARDRFDLVLAQGAAEKGAVLSFGEQVTDFTPGDKQVRLTVRSDSGAERRLTARFALDASGFGRVLARLLDLDRPSDLLRRRSVFTHVEDHIPPDAYDRNKVLISVHPHDPAIWYWLIPLKGGISSIGVVGLEATIEAAGGDDEARLQLFVSSSGRMGELLANAERIRPVDSITGYSCSVKSLIGQGYAMLGNAAEFLDPIFSSGVTIALKSATLASSALSRHLDGQAVDWQQDYVAPLSTGIETFRAFVEAWYDGSLQRIIFRQPSEANRIRRLIISVLAGYAWDADNPFVQNPHRYLALVRDQCGE